MTRRQKVAVTARCTCGLRYHTSDRTLAGAASALQAMYDDQLTEMKLKGEQTPY